MAAAGVALVLFRRINLPPVLGYLLAGVIVGPYTFAGIDFGPFANLDGLVQNLDVIRLLAELGLIILLFSVGLEIGWQRVRDLGLRVIIIGVVEMTTMFALGYWIGHIVLGWSALEGIFLGGALSISSSTILIKTLRDTGNLFHLRGRLIIGILVVEDFVAVVLLTVLSALASTGSASVADVGLLAFRLTVFGAAALVFGSLLAPRLTRYISRFDSDELLLITSLTLCFSLALAAHQLELSAAAGAFLIGMVLGDTDSAERIERIMAPVRDLFAALFFVSLGMLMNIFTFGDYLLPALVISAVFIVGKVLADTTGTLLAGYDGRTALRVGMGMPQLGEFSLAIGKTGADYGAVSGFFNPVLTVATAITALFYHFIFRSANRTADLIGRIAPSWLGEYGLVLSVWLTAIVRTFPLENPLARRIKNSLQLILLNMTIIIVLISLGTAALEFNRFLTDWTGLSAGLLGLLTGGAVLALCIPSGVAIWRSLDTMAESVMTLILPAWQTSSANAQGRSLRLILRNSILIVIMVLPAIWGIPLIAHLLLLGSIAAPVPAFILLGVTAGVAFAAFQMHGVLEATVRRTFLGPDELNDSDPEGGESGGAGIDQEPPPASPGSESGRKSSDAADSGQGSSVE